MANRTARPRGRPRQFDVEDAVSAALQLFWRRGYRNTTTRDLEAELGVTQSSLYHAFGSKAGLLLQVLDRYQAELDRDLLAPLHGAEDGAEGLSRFFRDLRTRGSTDRRGCLMVNLMADEASTDPGLVSRAAGHRARVRAALRAAVARSCPAASSATVDRRTDLLLAATLGLNLAARTASSGELGTIIASIDAEVASWARRESGGAPRGSLPEEREPAAPRRGQG